MIPIQFDEVNVVFGKPDTMTDEECGSLPALVDTLPNGQDVIVSCWQLSEDEIAMLTKTGRIYLTVYSKIMFPVLLSTEITV
ncbi:hypothetical protein FHS57_006241 [Runella defluvii]|uniref:Uncharacterized protein n=1 Tax=Runella defluvii TaxID=370973 RepID=A0A7W5ZRA9_9BACT|nr:hypothetical protein [Runella defluvii]